MSKFDKEVQTRWGETQAFQQSKERTSKYSPTDFELAKVDQEAATEAFAYACGNSLLVTSAEAQAAVTAHRAAISKWFYECSVEMQKNLAQMYISDERFKKYYDERLRSLAQYVHDSIMAQPN